jgi:hypothetical protein
MAKKCKASSLDTPTCYLATTLPIALTIPRRSQRETAVPDDNVESYQLPSHQLDLPVVLAQDSIASMRHLHVPPPFPCGSKGDVSMAETTVFLATLNMQQVLPKSSTPAVTLVLL